MPSAKFKSENYSNLGGMNTKASPYQTGMFQFLDIRNFDFTQPGALTKVPGTTQFLGTTLAGRMSSIYEFVRLNGFSQVILAANTNIYSAVVGGVPNAFDTGLVNNALFTFTTFIDRMFAANGDSFIRYDGSTAYLFSLPPGITVSFGVTAVSGGSLTPGVTTTFVCGYGYINERGYLGPACPGITIVVSGAANSITYYGLTAPAGYGVSSIALFRSSGTAVDLFRTISIAPGPTTVYTDLGLAQTTDFAPAYLWFTLAPRYFEIVNNQLLMAGFSNALSTIFWSDVGEPEGIQIDWQDEVRTNDGDRITGIKSYQGDAIIFKERSFHRGRFNSATDVSIAQVSDQYGCISHRAAAAFDSLLLFLDRQGIVLYDGAQPQMLSIPIEPIFRMMNIDAARDNACAIHYKDRKEVWFAIPINGATLNNCIVVYDYHSKAFYTRFGLNVSHLAMIKGGTSVERAFYSDYQGTIYNFGASITGDNGAGMTCLAKTRFVHDAGNSNEVLWRRLFLNCEPITGYTASVNVALYTDYSATASINQTIYMNPFQSRIDFGLAGKALAAQISSYSSQDAIKIYGFSFAYRYLRDV